MILSNSPQDSAAASLRRLSTSLWPGLEFAHTEEDILKGADWRIRDRRDVLVLHLHGTISSLETELEGCGAVLSPPLPGEVWVIPAGQRYHSRARGKRVRYAELFFDPQALAASTGQAIPTIPIRAHAGQYDEFLHRTVLRLIGLTDSNADGAGNDLGRMMAQTMSQTLLLHFYREYSQQRPVRARASVGLRLQQAEVRRIAEYIADHLGGPVMLDTLAALVSMKPHEFLQAFRAAFSTTPAQYIIEQRLRRARWLLVHTAKGIAAIAYETGFSSHSHLTTTFKARYGCTPQDCRF